MQATLLNMSRLKASKRLDVVSARALPVNERPRGRPVGTTATPESLKRRIKLNTKQNHVHFTP